MSACGGVRNSATLIENNSWIKIMSDQCPICFQKCDTDHKHFDYFFDCKVCGPYIVDRAVYSDYLVLTKRQKVKGIFKRIIDNNIEKALVKVRGVWYT